MDLFIFKKFANVVRMIANVVIILVHILLLMVLYVYHDYISMIFLLAAVVLMIAIMFKKNLIGGIKKLITKKGTSYGKIASVAIHLGAYMICIIGCIFLAKNTADRMSGFQKSNDIPVNGNAYAIPCENGICCVYKDSSVFVVIDGDAGCTDAIQECVKDSVVKGYLMTSVTREHIECFTSLTELGIHMESVMIPAGTSKKWVNKIKKVYDGPVQYVNGGEIYDVGTSYFAIMSGSNPQKTAYLFKSGNKQLYIQSGMNAEEEQEMIRQECLYDITFDSDYMLVDVSSSISSGILGAINAEYILTGGGTLSDEQREKLESRKASLYENTEQVIHISMKDGC